MSGVLVEHERGLQLVFGTRHLSLPHIIAHLGQLSHDDISKVLTSVSVKMDYPTSLDLYLQCSQSFPNLSSTNDAFSYALQSEGMT
jgi:hypothetical protein